MLRAPARCAVKSGALTCQHQQSVHRPLVINIRPAFAGPDQFGPGFSTRTRPRAEAVVTFPQRP